MDKKEILTYLKCDSSYFTNVCEKDFRTLANIETCELGFMNSTNFQITPLLRQICHFALISSNLYSTEIEQIINTVSSRQLAITMEQIRKFADYCFCYVDLLSNENCHHPSVLNVINLSAHLYYYDEIQDIVCDLASCIDDPFQKVLIDCLSSIDEKLLNLVDSLLIGLIQKMKQNIYSKETILKLLVDYVENKLLLCGMFGVPDKNQKRENTIYYVDQNYIHFSSQKSLYPGVQEPILKYLDNFSQLIQKIEYYKQYSYDDEALALIDEIEKMYSLYESYRYKYLKDSYQEQKLLEKCKKM